MIINHTYEIEYNEVNHFDFIRRNNIVSHVTYGPKIMKQVPYIVAALNDDRNSRQALIVMSTGFMGNDNACLISLQWLIREDILIGIFNFRSQCERSGMPWDSEMIKYITTVILKDLKNIKGVKLICNVADFHVNPNYMP